MNREANPLSKEVAKEHDVVIRIGDTRFPIGPDSGGSVRNTQFNGFAFQYANEVASTVSDLSACVAL